MAMLKRKSHNLPIVTGSVNIKLCDQAGKINHVSTNYTKLYFYTRSALAFDWHASGFLKLLLSRKSVECIYASTAKVIDK